MNALCFTTVPIPSGAIGRENPFPPFVKMWQTPNYTQFDPALPQEEYQYINYGIPPHTMPYAFQDNYGNCRHRREFKAAVLENNALRAIFLLEFGGRLWSLYDKKRQRELVYRNSVFQPCRIGTRNAWVSGGIEWNCGIPGHTPFTYSPVFAAEVPGAAYPLLRIYEWERIREMPYQVDFFLPDDDSEFLYAAARIVNPHDHELPMYWWTNIAVPQVEGMRVLTPSTQAITHEKGIKVATVPRWHDTDITYPVNLRRAIDFFFVLPKQERRWEAAVMPDGTGFVDVSTPALRGRKLFVWGNSVGGNNWQKMLTEGDAPYCEIQSGLAKTQMECLPMAPHATFFHLEAFGAFQGDPAVIHGDDWPAATGEVKRYLAGRLPEETFNAVAAEARRCAELPPESPVHYGSGWGALELERRRRCGEPSFTDAAPVFPADSMTELQQPWLALLQGAARLDDAAIMQPSWQINPFWQSYLAGAAQEAEANRTYCHYQLGLLHYAAGDLPAATAEMLLARCSGRPGLFVNRALAMLAMLQGRPAEAADYYLAALQEADDDMAMLEEGLKIFIAAGRCRQFKPFLDQYAGPDVDPDRLRLLKIQNALELDELEEVARLFADPLKPVEIREGDFSITDSYLIWQTKLLARAEGRQWDREFHAAKMPEIPVPADYEYRTQLAVI